MSMAVAAEQRPHEDWRVTARPKPSAICSMRTSGRGRKARRKTQRSPSPHSPSASVVPPRVASRAVIS